MIEDKGKMYLPAFAQRGIYPKAMVRRTINTGFFRKLWLDALWLCRRLPRCAAPNAHPIRAASTTLGDRGRAHAPTKCACAQRVNFVVCSGAFSEILVYSR